MIAALLQINATVGDLAGNTERIFQHAAQAADAGAQLIVFPELALSGYPPEDLVLKKHFLRACEQRLEELADQLPRDALVLVGCPREVGGHPANTAVAFTGGRIAGCYRKMALPNYGVFDEKRVFRAGEQPVMVQLNGMRIGIHICEDSWNADAPAAAMLAAAKPDALVNLSASPYHRGKQNLREEILSRMAARVQVPLLYCNLVGGQDELVFDGASLVLDPLRGLVSRARQFAEDALFFSIPPRGTEVEHRDTRRHIEWIIADVPAGDDLPVEPRIEPVLDDLAEVYAALKLGVRDYVEKNGFSKVVVALSGGIDSALVAAIAVDALGKDRVAGVTMPSQYSSTGTISDAGQLAANLGIEFHSVPIRDLFDKYQVEIEPLWKGRPQDITEENLQARIRANIIMALSNKFGWLVLTTGNKSELATGYCTLYGDMVGGFAVIKDVPKTLVFELARWRNAHGTLVIPPSTIDRPPSAELRPDQKDSDTLPPYDVLDAILERYIEQDLGLDEIVAQGFDIETVRKVLRMADRSEYKRRQGAPGIKITPKAFGRDRRMPITNRYGR